MTINYLMGAVNYLFLFFLFFFLSNFKGLFCKPICINLTQTYKSRATGGELIFNIKVNNIMHYTYFKIMSIFLISSGTIFMPYYMSS